MGIIYAIVLLDIINVPSSFLRQILPNLKGIEITLNLVIFNYSGIIICF